MPVLFPEIEVGHFVKNRWKLRFLIIARYNNDDMYVIFDDGSYDRVETFYSDRLVIIT